MRTQINGKTLLASAVVALALTAGAAGPTQAKGCIKGAIVGGLAGHMAHHGVLGAAGGCAVGHHMASRRQNQVEQQQGTNYDQQPRTDYDQQQRTPYQAR